MPWPGRFGAMRETVGDTQRLGDVAVEAEAMRFEIAAVGAGGEQMHGDVMRAMAGYRHVERLGEMGDFHEGGDAAAIGDVGLGIGHRAGGDILLELPQAAQVLAGGDRQAALAHDARMAGRIVRDRRLFEPGEIVGRKRAGGADRFVDAPFHIGVGHQREAIAEMGAHRFDALDILSEARAADLHLDRAKAFGEIVVGLAQQFVERQVEIDAAGVARDLGVEAAEKVP